MTRVLDIGLVALFIVATSIWVGGLVVIAEVAHATRSALTPEDSVPFFRTLGRTHGVVGSGALLVALVTGGVLLRHHRWDGALVATAVVAVALVVISVIGMAHGDLPPQVLPRGSYEASRSTPSPIGHETPVPPIPQ